MLFPEDSRFFDHVVQSVYSGIERGARENGTKDVDMNQGAWACKADGLESLMAFIPLCKHLGSDTCGTDSQLFMVHEFSGSCPNAFIMGNSEIDAGWGSSKHPLLT
jgi:hypothetical protein